MLDFGDFCIDATEVTQAQYQAFLASKNGDTTGQPAACGWNTSFQPFASCNFAPATRASQPVSGVDWCDAYAFCAWTGKQMCGRIGGGARSGAKSAPAPSREPAKSQWTAACTKRGDG